MPPTLCEIPLFQNSPMGRLGEMSFDCDTWNFFEHRCSLEALGDSSDKHTRELDALKAVRSLGDMSNSYSIGIGRNWLNNRITTWNMYTM